MSTARNGNGHAPNGAGPVAENGMPLVQGGMAIAGSPLELAELERLANEMFRAGPEGAGLGPQPEALQWSSVMDGTQSRTPSAPAPPPVGGDLFGLQNRPLPLDELGLAETRRVSAPDHAANSYYFVEEASALARAMPVAGGAAPAPETASAPPVPPGETSSAPPVHPAFDLNLVRAEFPVLSEHVHGRPLVWLDNAATTQKPEAVISRLSHFYRHENSNVHRGAHEMAARATDAYEASRSIVARFLNAPSSDEIVFVRGATEAINLVAQAWGRQNVSAGDEILITWLEHHANIVPWQQLCRETGAVLKVVPVDDSGQVLLDEYERLLGPRTRLVSFAHVSNALGTVLPAREMVQMAHRHGAVVLIDGAQAVSHMPVDVQDLDCDWYAFSGHKVFGPTGIGVLHGKQDLLNAMPPWQGGGNMIQDVTFQKTVYQPAPVRFEAGTASIADAVGLGAAFDYLQRIGMVNINAYEQDLLAYATTGLLSVPGLHLIGTAPEKASVLSFVLDGFEPEAVGKALDQAGIAVRAGHHCAQPIVRRFGHEGTVRGSLAFYNSCEDVDALITALHAIVRHTIHV